MVDVEPLLALRACVRMLSILAMMLGYVLTVCMKEPVTTVLGTRPSGSTRILPCLSKMAAPRVIFCARRADCVLFLAVKIARPAMIKQAATDCLVLGRGLCLVAGQLGGLARQMTTITVALDEATLLPDLMDLSRNSVPRAAHQCIPETAPAKRSAERTRFHQALAHIALKMKNMDRAIVLAATAMTAEPITYCIL